MGELRLHRALDYDEYSEVDRQNSSLEIPSIAVLMMQSLVAFSSRAMRQRRHQFLSGEIT